MSADCHEGAKGACSCTCDRCLKDGKCVCPNCGCNDPYCSPCGRGHRR